MNPRFVYLLVAIGAIALDAASVSHADGEHDTDRNNEEQDADFSDSEQFSDLNIEQVADSKNEVEARNRETAEKYGRLFGDQSEPLEPEEALKKLVELLGIYEEDYARAESGTYAKLKIELYASDIQGLIEIDSISRDCKLSGRGMAWISKVFDDNEKKPALEPYLRSRLGKLFEACKPSLADDVHWYEDMATKTEPSAKIYKIALVLKNSLASVPNELVLNEEYLSTKSDQVSAALSEAYYFCYDGESFQDKIQKRFRKMFNDLAIEVCGRMRVFPSGFLGLVIQHQDVAGQVLDREVIDWLKVERVCQQVYPNRRAVADIVFEYNGSERARKRAAKKQCKGFGCFLGLGTKATSAK